MDELEHLRSEVDRCDRELLRAAAQRLRVARKIGALKAERAISVFDRAREEAVVARAEEHAKELEIDPALARRLIQELIEESRDLQVSRVTQTPQTILIIGAHGRMGSLFVKALTGIGHRVTGLDREDRLEPATIHGADIVLLAVPLHLMRKIAEQVVPSMRSDALLCDIGSLKEEICRFYESEVSCEAVGLHPLFGPVASLQGQTIALTPIRSRKRAASLCKDLKSLGAQMIDISPKQHDEMMAVVQALNHFSSLCFGQCLLERGVPLSRAMQLATPSFLLELQQLKKLTACSADLLIEIQRANPYAEGLRRAFAQGSERLASASPEELKQLLTELASLVDRA